MELQEIDVWYDATGIVWTSNNNMMELYFEETDIEAIIKNGV